MEDEKYELIDNTIEEVLRGDAYKMADKWVVRRVRMILHEMVDDGVIYFSGDILYIYIASVFSGYATRIDNDYSTKDTVVDDVFLDTKLFETLISTLDGYKPHIQARALHFLLENFPERDEYDEDPIFELLAIYCVLGFATGFVFANLSEEDDEVKEKMSAPGLTKEQCQSAAISICSDLNLPKKNTIMLSHRMKDLCDKETAPRSGIKKGFPISDDPKPILRLYSVGYAIGASYGLDAVEGKVELSSKRFAVPEYLVQAERLWNSWCLRRQHTIVTRRAAKAGWVFYLAKENGALLNKLEFGMTEDTPLDERTKRIATRIVNNINVFQFMRGWVDGFADAYYDGKKEEQKTKKSK